jgi:hypothetical protein
MAVSTAPTQEGYELIDALVKVNPISANLLLKLLKGTTLVPDEGSPTGYKEEKLKGVKVFCNNDGVDKILDLLLLHINTPLSYKENSQSPSQIAGQIAKQFIKDIAANFEHWEISNPSLIPQLAEIIFQFIKTAQVQNTKLTESLSAR